MLFGLGDGQFWASPIRSQLKHLLTEIRATGKLLLDGGVGAVTIEDRSKEAQRALPARRNTGYVGRSAGRISIRRWDSSLPSCEVQ